MLENIGSAVERKLLEQHEEKRKNDPKINKESISKKIELVGKVITEHIINGNDVKLLINVKEDKKVEELQKEVSEKAIEVKAAYKQLGKDDIKLLTSTYEIKEELEKKL
jgi:hypothetical protein